MFAQFIAARTSDREAYNEHIRRWYQEQSSQAEGWLLGVGGVTARGESLMLILFESEEQARRNSDRPEQGHWWQALLTCLEGAPEVIDSAAVDRYGSGDLMQAGFVQFIRAQVSDQERMRSMSQEMAGDMLELRPDILGGITLWYPGGSVDVVGFTSEAEARQGEQRQIPADFEEKWGEISSLMSDMRYYDMAQPVLMSREHAPA